MLDVPRAMQIKERRRVQTMDRCLADVAGHQVSLHMLKHGDGQEALRIGSSHRRHVARWVWDRGSLSV